ncbi:MAG: DUF4058 family protein [Caldilineaceae bacterium]
MLENISSGGKRLCRRPPICWRSICSAKAHAFSARCAEPPSAPYYVYLSRANRRPYTVIWVVSVRTPLPTVPVPLLRPDPDVALDLQAAINACFELVGYEMLLDYAAPPPDGLDEDERKWVVETLQMAGYAR